MAIAKTTFSGETRTAQYAEILSFMQTNGDGYFDTITGDSSTGVITCSITGNTNDSLIINCNSADYIMSIKFPSGMGVSTENLSAPSIKFDYGVTTSHGIYLHWTYDTSYPQYPSFIFITKSNDDTSFVVYGNYNDSGVAIRGADLVKDQYWSQTLSLNQTRGVAYGSLLSAGSTFTTLTPFVARYDSSHPPAAEAYTPHLFVLHFNEHRGEVGKLMMNGKSYFTNGYFALED